jgi:hypothetical protein
MLKLIHKFPFFIIFFTPVPAIVFSIFRIIYRYISDETEDASCGGDKPLIVIYYTLPSLIYISLSFSFCLLIIFAAGITIYNIIFLNSTIAGYDMALILVSVIICLFLPNSLRFLFTKRFELYNDRIIQTFIFFKQRQAILSKAYYYLFAGGAYGYPLGMALYDYGRPKFIAKMKRVSIILSFFTIADKTLFLEFLAKLAGRKSIDEFYGDIFSKRLMKDSP